jgi:hypothetical protein
LLFIVTVDHGCLAESETITRLRDFLRKHTNRTLDYYSSKYALGDEITSLKSAINTLANEDESTIKEIRSHLPVGVDIERLILVDLQDRLEGLAIPEKLQNESPPPSEPPSRDDRERFSNAVFDVFINEFDGALEKVDTSEERREKVKESLERVRPTVVNITVTVGKITSLFMYVVPG